MAQTVTSTFSERLSTRAAEIDSLLCVGLDPTVDRLPSGFARTTDGVVSFLESVIEATSDQALCYKPNLAFYLALGSDGFDALYRTCAAIPSSIPILLDCKVNDMGVTAEHYAQAWFDELQVDAITVAPYMGEDACEPYFRNPEKGVFILTKTSNPGSGDFQNRDLAHGPRLYQEVAKSASAWEQEYPASIGLVVGATWPETFAEIRESAPDLWYLVPGVGAQGGDVEGSLRSGLRPSLDGLLISSSRGLLYAGDQDAVRTAALTLANEIRDVRASMRASG